MISNACWLYSDSSVMHVSVTRLATLVISSTLEPWTASNTRNYTRCFLDRQCMWKVRQVAPGNMHSLLKHPNHKLWNGGNLEVCFFFFSLSLHDNADTQSSMNWLNSETDSTVRCLQLPLSWETKLQYVICRFETQVGNQSWKLQNILNVLPLTCSIKICAHHSS